MAHAETGDFETAVSLQQEALETARAFFRLDLIPDLTAHLRRFENGEPLREPWSLDALRMVSPPVAARRAFRAYPPDAPF
jgi:hypothetical protein